MSWHRKRGVCSKCLGGRLGVQAPRIRCKAGHSVGLQHPSGLEQGEGELRGVLEDGSDHAVAGVDGVSFENEQRVEECRVSAAENVKASEGCEEAQGRGSWKEELFSSLRNGHVYLHKQATGAGGQS